MPMPVKDIASQRFGYLLALRRVEGYSRPRWLCLCDCGQTVVKDGYRLRRGIVKSCGCQTRALIAVARRTHGMTGSRLEYIRRGMMARCHIPHRKDYPRYGGRGIRVCASWRHDASQFYRWALTHGYDDALSIDRIDPDKDYSPDNCRWIPLADNVAAANRRRRVHP